MHENIGRAVCRQRVVKFRLSSEPINGCEVVKKDPSYPFNGSLQSIEIDLLRWILPIIGPHPNHIPLVSHHIVEFILFEEAFYC